MPSLCLAPASCRHVGRSPVVFCDSCTQALCELCITSGSHRSHEFKTVEDACKEQIHNISNQMKAIEEEARKQGDLQQTLAQHSAQLEEEIQNAREMLEKQYQDLQDLLEQNKKQALRLLEAESDRHRKILYRVEDEGGNFKTRTATLKEEIRVLKDTISSEGSSASILLEIQAHQLSIITVNDFFQTVTTKIKFDKSRLDALKNSVQQIEKQCKEIFPRPWEFYQKITFQTDVSGRDVDHVFGQQSTTFQIPAVAGDTQTYNKVALQSWKSGQHYWEVNVENCRKWAVGIIEGASVKKMPEKEAERWLGRDKSSWVLESEDGELAALHNDDIHTVRERDVKRLGVHLDISKKKDRSRLTFYDVNGGVVLHKFYARVMKNPVPVFSLTSLANQQQKLILCNMEDGAQNQVDNDDTVSEDSGFLGHRLSLSSSGRFSPGSESIELSGESPVDDPEHLQIGYF